MVDRQDIDALLIGSLYGELSSTEEARLSAHLDSHPTDRTALANLTRAREVVRESRILQVQFDPPQSVSALLMQEAARRAPKVRDEQSWFQRFMRSFIAHPAMAAAATLVLVIGVAGTVYMKRGDNFAKATKDDSSAPSLTPASPNAGPSADQAAPIAPTEQPANGVAQNESGNADNRLAAQGSAAATTTAPTTDDYKVKLDDDGEAQKAPDRIVTDERARELALADKNKKQGEANYRGGFDRNQPTKPAKPADSSSASDLAKETTGTNLRPSVPNSNPVVVAKPEPAKADPKPESKVAKAAPATAPKQTPPRLEVTTPTQAPKDFGSVASSRDDLSRKGDATGVGAGGGTASRTTNRPGTASPPPAPPPPPPTVAVEEKDKKAQDKAATELAWAKERHGKVIAAVNAGKCELAAKYAVEIANRNSAYYTANVLDDRFVKPCAQYINAQREREAERTQRAKSTQRQAVDEAPAPAPTRSTTTK